MKERDLKVIYLSSFPPRECGIATFTQSYIDHIHEINSFIDQKVIAVDEIRAEKRDYPAIVKYHLEAEELESYEKVARYINESGADVFCLQHEYGLFGGFDGIFILKLLEKINVPTVTFFHSVPVVKEAKKREFRLKILKKITNHSKFVIVTANLARNFLIKKGFPRKKIITIHHGGVEIPFPKREEKEKLKKKKGMEKRFVILTYGLIVKNKGIDYAIEAIKNLKEKYPQILYLVLGEAHPIHIRAMEKDYYSSLQEKVKKWKLEKHVKFIPKFLEEKEIIEYLKLCDIYLLPYLTKEQISSGTLANAMTTGCCVVSTPFPYAREMLDEKRGFFINFKDSKSIEETLKNLIENQTLLDKTRKKAYLFSKKFTWPNVARQVIKIFQQARKL